jgi:uncharacterized protein
MAFLGPLRRVALDPEEGRRFALALAVSLAGGAAFHALGLPLPWMLGATFLATVAAIAGLPVAIPGGARSLMMAVLGVMLGSAFTPEVMESASLWLGSIAAMVAYAVVVSLVVYLLLRRLLGYDPVTAYFAGTPGGLSEMTLIGGALGGDERTIALTHSLRIVLIVFAIAFGFQWFGGYVPAGASAGGWVPMAALGAGDVLVLLVCGVLGALCGRALRLPAGMLLGPMVLSGAAHLAGLTAVPPPSVLVAAAQIVVGGSIGCRFVGTPMRLLRRAAAASLGVAGLMLAATLGFAAALAPLTGLPFAALVLAFAPGGLAEMALIALALGIDTAFVSTHNVFRVLAIIVLAPLVFRIALRRTLQARAPAGDD